MSCNRKLPIRIHPHHHFFALWAMPCLVFSRIWKNSNNISGKATLYALFLSLPLDINSYELSPPCAYPSTVPCSISFPQFKHFTIVQPSFKFSISFIYNRCQNSKLSAFKRKYFIPMMTNPSSFLQGFLLPFTMTIFLKESGILRKELNSCVCFSSEVMSYAT